MRVHTGAWEGNIKEINEKRKEKKSREKKKRKKRKKEKKETKKYIIIKRTDETIDRIFLLMK